MLAFEWFIFVFNFAGSYNVSHNQEFYSNLFLISKTNTALQYTVQYFPHSYK